MITFFNVDIQAREIEQNKHLLFVQSQFIRSLLTRSFPRLRSAKVNLSLASLTARKKHTIKKIKINVYLMRINMN